MFRSLFILRFTFLSLLILVAHFSYCLPPVGSYLLFMLHFLSSLFSINLTQGQKYKETNLTFFLEPPHLCFLSPRLHNTVTPSTSTCLSFIYFLLSFFVPFFVCVCCFCITLSTYRHMSILSLFPSSFLRTFFLCVCCFCTTLT